MQNDSTIKKISFVAFSNIIKLISSVLIGFFIPNILGLTNYSFYKVFTLYLTYIGLFHFGFIDGIYLKYGGIEYSSLNKIKFRLYFRFFIYFELIIVSIGMILTLLFVDGEKKIIFILLFLNLISINLTTYYQFISQITSRFKEYSTRLIVLSITNIIIVAILYLLKISDYRIYIGCIIAVNYFLLFWYIYTYRDISFGKSGKISDVKNDLLNLFRLGIPLLLANLASTFVVTVDKQIVEIFFPVEVFGIYSFAFNMLTMITVVVSAVGVVLYPILKNTSMDNISRNYSNLNRVIVIIVLIGLVGYFPLLWIIPKFLPDYVDSLIIFRIALPGLVLTSSISAVKFNFYKIIDKSIDYFIIGLGTVIISILINLIFYKIYGTVISIAIASVIGLSIWYILTEIYMVKKHNIQWKLNALLIFMGISTFYIITSIDNLVISGIIYACFITIIFLLNYKIVFKTLRIK
ncbi:MAG: lipopolysaccharide biosynthesis protein [Candidatus Izemoplasmatales bacterium]|nr:lipopolysaccharide biosynthesis protein [Candidatus Izemoplasmatales bacterium]